MDSLLFYNKIFSLTDIMYMSTYKKTVMYWKSLFHNETKTKNIEYLTINKNGLMRNIMKNVLMRSFI